MQFKLVLPLSCLLLLAPISFLGAGNRFVRASWALSLFESSSLAGPGRVVNNAAQMPGQLLGTRDSSSSMFSSPLSMAGQMTSSAGSTAASMADQATSSAGNLLDGLSGDQLQQLLSSSNLMELTQNPASSMMPQTLQGLNSDLNSGYQMLSNGAQRGFQGLSSASNSASNSAQSGYQQLMSGLGNPNRYLDSATSSVSNSGDQLMRRLTEMLSNPEQMCRQLVQQTRSLMQNLQEQSSSSSPTNQLSSMFNRFG